MSWQDSRRFHESRSWQESRSWEECRKWEESRSRERNSKVERGWRVVGGSGGQLPWEEREDMAGNRGPGGQLPCHNFTLGPPHHLWDRQQITFHYSAWSYFPITSFMLRRLWRKGSIMALEVDTGSAHVYLLPNCHFYMFFVINVIKTSHTTYE